MVGAPGSSSPRLYPGSCRIFNDNTHAIRFCQKYGFPLKAVHIGAIEEVRRLKSGVPKLGNDGIPIEHEFEFEILL